MNSVKKLLVLCTFVSLINLYEFAATVDFKIEPVRPVLNNDLTFSCEANYNTNKLQKLSVLAGSTEFISYQPNKRPRVQWRDDATKTRFDFKKELSKTRTYLQMTLKKPKCTDQNIYKCIYYEKGQDPIEQELRLNFYVDKGDVKMIDNRKSDCSPINITCIGQAGNPPELMKWLKKRKGDSTFEEIEPSYITSEMSFHQTNCSNSRKEHFNYNPSVAETDLVIKCGFGDLMEHMSFHTPVIVPERFAISVLPERPHRVGEDIQLTCTGLGVTDQTRFRWYKKTKDYNDMIEITPPSPQQNFRMADDMCHTVASESIAYIPEINDEVIYCEAEDNGQMAKAEWNIQLGVISNPTDGITTKDTDDDDDDDDHDEDHDGGHDHDEDGDEDHDMTTSMPSTGEEGSKPESEPEGKAESTTMDKMLIEPASKESGQLRSSISNFFLISFLVVIAFQFMLDQSS